METPEINICAEPEIPAPRFTKKHKTAAWCALAAGFFAVRLTPAASDPLGSLLLSLGLYLATSVFIFTEGRSPRIKDIVIPTAATILSFGQVVSSDPVLRTITVLTLCLLYVYWVRSALDPDSEGFPGKLAVFELIRAVFVVALPSMGQLWPALFSRKKDGSKNTVLWVLLGFAVALVPTAAIVSLLSYDKAFTEILNKFTSWNIFGTVGKNVTSVIFGIPVAMFVFALVYGSQKNLRKDVLSPDTCDRVISAIRFAPAPLAAAAMTPALLIYVVFFISQKNNYIYALTGLKPNGINYADFARDGFFELCAVAAINAVIILTVSLFTKRVKEKEPLIRTYSAVYSVFTLVLIATALAKMFLYIREFGLTRLRLLTSCFMILLALCFGAVLLAQFIRKIRLAGVFGIAAILVLASVTLIDTDRIIAEYNVNSYLSGYHEYIDVAHFYQLGHGAVPAAVELWQSEKTDYATKDEAKYFLENTAWEFRYAAGSKSIFENFFASSIPASRAKAALESAGFSTEPDPNESYGTNEIYDSRFDS